MNSVPVSSSFQIVCPIAELPIGKSKRIILNDIPVALFHIEQGYFAIEDTCSHQGASLAFGSIDGFCVACPRHGAMFDIRTGDVLSLPALRGVKNYVVNIEDGNIVISTSPTSDKQPDLLRY